MLDNSVRRVRARSGFGRGARSSPASRTSAAPAEVRLAALALGASAVTSFVCLLLMFAGIERLGTVNDYLNGVIGWLALALAVVVRRHDGGGWKGDAAVVAAALGALVMTWGSWLVVTGTTGYYLAGLVSTLGVAAIGAWLLLARSGSARGGPIEPRPTRLGRATGLVMLVGVLALPGMLTGYDDMARAPWHSLASGIAWLGAYVLLPIWCLRLRSAIAPPLEHTGWQS